MSYILCCVFKNTFKRNKQKGKMGQTQRERKRQRGHNAKERAKVSTAFPSHRAPPHLPPSPQIQPLSWLLVPLTICLLTRIALPFTPEVSPLLSNSGSQFTHTHQGKSKPSSILQSFLPESWSPKPKSLSYLLLSRRTRVRFKPNCENQIYFRNPLPPSSPCFGCSAATYNSHADKMPSLCSARDSWVSAVAVHNFPCLVHAPSVCHPTPHSSPVPCHFYILSNLLLGKDNAKNRLRLQKSHCGSIER